MLKYPHLFQPIRIGNMLVPNRICHVPTDVSSSNADGSVSERDIHHHSQLAKGGVGLIIVGATSPDAATGRPTVTGLVADSDTQIPGLARLAESMHKYGAKCVVQLQHPGRQCAWPRYNTMSATDMVVKLPWSAGHEIVYENAEEKGKPVRAMTTEEVVDMVDKFSESAWRVKQAVFDGVELHAAHGYLIQEFLSPYTNRRTDEYGGSFENRMRFVTNIIRKIREKCGTDFPLVVRLSVDEFYREIGELENGYTLEEGVRIAKRLEELGVDAIDVSSGTYETMNYWLEPTEFECGWRKNLAKAVREQVRVPVLAANLIRSPEQAEQQLAEGIQDFISLGRPLLADSQWAQKAAANRADDIKRCICCLWCFESMLEGEERRQAGQCTVNPRVCREVAVPMDPPRDGDGRRVIIAGAGPAGLTAAEVLAKRGFQVTVYEKEARAGGQLTLAELPPHKEKLGWCTQDLEHAALKNGAVIEYNHPATAQEILDQKPYAVLVATGAVACKPKGIPGAERENVHTSDYALRHGKDFAGRTVAVVGSGMTGLETAELLADNGAKVFIIEMAENIAPGTYHQHLDRAVPLLRSKGVAILTGQKLSAVDDGSVTFTDTKSGESQTRAADDVVIAIGVEQVHVLYEELKGRQENLFIVGDAAQKGRIASATRAAFDCAWALK